ncbi:hypothetical protein CHARACLAT_005296 [Characodon lateralis]|uniref:Uncharacterized protein n=1 Tax=Characodon lateralis TaxID=208331 RepID=A0ABU7D7F9_9TELE|nr:hypothetical protein [Characodon lateralis]
MYTTLQIFQYSKVCGFNLTKSEKRQVLSTQKTPPWQLWFLSPPVGEEDTLQQKSADVLRSFATSSWVGFAVFPVVLLRPPGTFPFYRNQEWQQTGFHTFSLSHHHSQPRRASSVIANYK